MEIEGNKFPATPIHRQAPPFCISTESNPVIKPPQDVACSVFAHINSCTVPNGKTPFGKTASTWPRPTSSCIPAGGGL
ncbi:hypothetical protein [Mucilaginibacter sp.]